MNNLPKNAAQFREALSKIKLWAVAAGVGAVVLLGFYAIHGVQYWNAWQDERTMTAEIERIALKLDQGTPNTVEVAHNLETLQARLDYLKSVYQYPNTDRLIGILSTTSWDTGVDLPSISAADPTFREIDGMNYRVQVLSVNVRGDLHNIYRFLAAVQEKVKVVSTPNISVSNPSNQEPSAQVQFTFYLIPNSTSDSNGAD